MALQAALDYIRRLRAELQRHPERRQGIVDGRLADLLAEAAAAGLAFSEAELRQAHRLDWALRFQRYS